MRRSRLAPWVGLALAVSCALPELVVDPSLDDEDAGEGGEGLSVGGATGGQGGRASGGASGSGRGGQGGAAGTDATGATSGTDTEGGGGSSQGGEATGGAAGTDMTGGQGGSNNGGNAGSNNGGNGGRGGLGGMSSGGSGMGGSGMAGAGKGGSGVGGAGVGGSGMAGAGKGGSGVGGAGSGGKGGSGGSPVVCPSIAELFPANGSLGSLDGRLAMVPCADTNSDDCSSGGFVYNSVTTPCAAGSLNVQQDFTVGGVPGVTYQVTMHFYGILGPKNYGVNVTRESGTVRPVNNNTGATPAPFASANAGVAYMVGDYDTSELHVLDNNLAEIRQYFLNSDTQEGHWTYVINYERTIPVIGGGRIRMRTYDRNCRMIKNCYNGMQGTAAQCGAFARSVDVSAAMPPPSGLIQPGLGNSSDQSGQWLLVDVTGVSCP